MVSAFTPRVASLAGALVLASCLGRVSSTDHVRTLPFHADEATFDGWPVASIAPPKRAHVGADVRIGDFVGYYPLPAGVFAKAPPYNEAGAWAPIAIEPAPEQALATWLDRSIHRAGGGPTRTIDGVVTVFEWHFHDGIKAGGRIATALSVRADDGRILFSGERVTAARVPFVDALFRVHVGEWLADDAFVAALGGGAR